MNPNCCSEKFLTDVVGVCWIVRVKPRILFFIFLICTKVDEVNLIRARPAPNSGWPGLYRTLLGQAKVENPSQSSCCVAAAAAATTAAAAAAAATTTATAAATTH